MTSSLLSNYEALRNPAVRDDDVASLTSRAGAGPAPFTRSQPEIRFNDAASAIASPRRGLESNDDRDERARILAALDRLSKKQGTPDLEYSRHDDLTKLKRTEMAMRKITGARQVVTMMKRGMCFLASALEWLSNRGIFKGYLDLTGYSQHIQATKDSYDEQLNDVYEYMGSMSNINPIVMLVVSFASNTVFFGMSRAMQNKKLMANARLKAENEKLRAKMQQAQRQKTTRRPNQDPLLAKMNPGGKRPGAGAIDLQSLYSVNTMKTSIPTQPRGGGSYPRNAMSNARMGMRMPRAPPGAGLGMTRAPPGAGLGMPRAFSMPAGQAKQGPMPVRTMVDPVGPEKNASVNPLKQNKAKSILSLFAKKEDPKESDSKSVYTVGTGITQPTPSVTTEKTTTTEASKSSGVKKRVSDTKAEAPAPKKVKLQV